MSNDLIKFKRGNADVKPTLANGEPYFAIDTGKLYIGNGNGDSVINATTLTPFDFGAVGDGVTDDGLSLNLLFDSVRNIIASGGLKSAVVVDLGGKSYYTSIPINATAIQSWGWSIINGSILGGATNKNILELTGSRGGRLSNITIEGLKDSMPKCGIFIARSTNTSLGLQFCDMNYFDNVTVFGYFETCGLYTYANETTQFNHCRFWNTYKDGYSAVLTGIDSVPFVSEYQTVVTGAESFVNNKYINCDFRSSSVLHLITGATKATTCVITSPDHGLLDGESIIVAGVVGMTELNNKSFTVRNPTQYTFQLEGIDSTGYTDYISGGFTFLKTLKPTVYLSRCAYTNFDNCYIVGTGDYSLMLDLGVDSFTIEYLLLDILFEGTVLKDNILMNVGNAPRIVNGLTVKNNRNNANNSIIGDNAVSGGSLTLNNFEAKIYSTLYDAPLFNNVAIVGVSNGSIEIPKEALLDIDSFYAFTGKVFNKLEDTSLMIGTEVQGITSYKNFTPVLRCSAGSIASYTATGRYYTYGGKVRVIIEFSITDVGTGAGTLFCSLPISGNSISSSVLVGRENNATGLILQGLISPNSSEVAIFNANNAFPIVTGALVYMSGDYDI